MEQRTHAQPQQHSPAPLTPQPNRILAEPATVAACARDYEAAAPIRQRMDEQTKRAR